MSSRNTAYQTHGCGRSIAVVAVLLLSLAACTIPVEHDAPPLPRAESVAIVSKGPTDELKARLQKLETRLTGERTRQRALRDSLVAVNSKVTSLSEELTYWKSEVRRIDAEAEEQHRQDLESLQTISELISRLPRPSTAAAGNASRH